MAFFKKLKSDYCLSIIPRNTLMLIMAPFTKANFALENKRSSS